MLAAPKKAASKARAISPCALFFLTMENGSSPPTSLATLESGPRLTVNASASSTPTPPLDSPLSNLDRSRGRQSAPNFSHEIAKMNQTERLVFPLESTILNLHAACCLLYT